MQEAGAFAPFRASSVCVADVADGTTGVGGEQHKTSDAVKFFNMALEFDPKNANANEIKAALAKVDVPDDTVSEPEL